MRCCSAVHEGGQTENVVGAVESDDRLAGAATGEPQGLARRIGLDAMIVAAGEVWPKPHTGTDGTVDGLGCQP